MRTGSLVAILLVACSPSGVSAPEDASRPAPPPAASPEPKQEPSAAAERTPTRTVERTPTPAVEPTPTPTPTVGGDAPTLASLCESNCLDAVMMRAVGIEQLEAECRERCTTILSGPPNAACAATARTSRAAVEGKPMPDRARHVFTLLSDPALSCDVQDPVLQGLAAAWRELDPARRRAALRAALGADPWLPLTCPSGVAALDEATHHGSVDRLVERCPIDGATAGAPIHADLEPLTFLAVEVIRTHWKAAGATSSDHDILLDTVLLSSALSRER